MKRVCRYCRCGSPLARDNTASLCSACQRARQRDRAPDVPPDFWHADLMVEALASGDLGRIVRAYRSHPFHGQPLPQSIVAGWLHVSQMTLSRIENRQRRLTVDDVNWFARSLGMPMALRWVYEHPSEAREDVDSISRRSLFGAGAGAAFGLNATTAPTAARDIDPELSAHWMKLLRLLCQHDAMFGPHDVLATVRHQLGLIARHRQVARGDLRIDLLRVESRWSEFAGWLSNDAGDSRMYDHWTDRALRLAQEGGYQDMVAWTLMLKSRDAASRDDPQRAIALADAARRTPGTTDQSRALSAFRVAQGHAVANDATSFERSLADAHALLGALRETPPEDLAAKDVSPAYVLADEAGCWLRLRPNKAIAMFEETLRLWPRERTRGRGFHQARLALACAAVNEPDRAAAEGIKALGIVRTTKSNLTMRELRRLDRQLAACDLPAAADFREAFATV
jgi:transcriptional regulator with XRE-family HTH domain